MKIKYTPAQLEFFRRAGAEGAKKRNKNCTKKQLSEWGKKGAKARDRNQKRKGDQKKSR